MWFWNSRVFPDISPLVVSKNDRVRVRVGNLTMTNHPVHMLKSVISMIRGT
ncbi:multicopper oxidase domain-containing protein [Rhizobium leguminosarum]